MELTLGLIGFGNTGRAFVRLLLAKRRELLTRYGVSFRVTGITTKTHGSAIDPEGLDCKRALRRVEAGKSIADLHVGLPLADAIDFIRRRPARILFELTPLNPWNGLPALDHVRVALQKGLHVVTANKGPVAVAYRELRHLAREKKLAFRFEGTVLDGTPVFNLVEKTLLGTQILGFHGILNSTCNLVLSEMEKGKSRESALKKARAMGVAEADASHDIEGWDSVAKTAVLANVLLDADIQPADVTRMGIGAVGPEDLKRAREKGKVLRLIGRASRTGQSVKARVAPELLDRSDPLSTAVGTTNALAIETDTMKELVLMERDPGVEQTAYALLSDLLAIATGPFRW